MNLFSPDRPRLSNGTKALLLDNSAVPQVIAVPIENNRVHLAVMVRDHSADEPYAYHWKETEVPFSQLELFFKHYVDDPEDALLSYFQWTDTVPLATKAKATVIPIRQNQATPTTVTDVLNDLL